MLGARILLYYWTHLAEASSVLYVSSGIFVFYKKAMSKGLGMHCYSVS